MSAIVEFHNAEITDRLIEHLRSSLCIAEPFDLQTDLVMAGALDSLMIIDLVAYVEQTYPICIAPRDISPQNFRFVHALSRLITDKLADQPSGVEAP